uniref:GTP-binding protein n=1 Tax=Coccolithus braarudii TaxID=221442 RepID=A0A7S0L5P4_9EUKA
MSALHGLADSYHFSFSLLVVGETSVGKSQLIACTLPEGPLKTVAPRDVVADEGVQCKPHVYESRGARYQILMWEVPGAPRYVSTVPRYAAISAGLVLVFDVSRRATFDRVIKWLEAADATSPDMPKVLVGNKSDLPAEVIAEEAIELAQTHDCKYFETCATSNEQVPEAFSSLIALIVGQIPNPPEPSLLLRKRIQIGKQLAENKSFRAALFDMA